MDSVSVKWYGINSLEVRHANGSFMIDPYVSRSREKLYIPEEVDKYITSKPDFILMTHAHWDHLPDMPHILRKTGSVLYASRTACMMMRALGVPEAQLHELRYGEVLNFPGKWSSYPPHHHPQPEVYFYRFDYPHGFGAGFANGEIYRTGNNGLAVINHGFHSQCAAPGYAMCYAWGIRHLEGDPWLKTRIDDEEHSWLWKPDANDHIFKG